MNWLFTFVNVLFGALNLAILIRVILSWINVGHYNPAVSIIYQITDPIIEPLRRIIPAVGMLDITPFVALMLLWVAQQITLSVLTAILR